ncbi:hypothetical protein HQ545_01645 [Candidatus Woesearchaeota archaeon]|nr:hypothetical protein [Candidatus Woesearchaeota archaeon]
MEDEIARRAFTRLFPEEDCKYSFRVVYTGRLKDYGANVSFSSRSMEFKLSRKWYGISEEIQMGIMQELMLKILKRKKKSLYVDLYNNFVKNLHLAVPKNDVDPFLQQSFERINERYFLGLVEMPNLVWGRFATRTFGSYDFKNDRVTISKVFQDIEDPVYLDYVMFHEILHKQRKFFKSGNKTYYHDKRFKMLEKVFEDGERVEKELGRVVGGVKRRRTIQKKFLGWF